MSRNQKIILVLILVLAGFLRFYHLSSTPPGLYPDEAMNGNNALEALHTGEFKVYYPENNGREGLFINIQALFLKLFGVNEPWVLRFPSALFGTLTVLGLFFLGQELFSVYVGLFSSFLLATSFWHLNFSRIGFRAILAPFFLVWALFFFLKSLKQVKYSDLWIVSGILAGTFFGLGFYTYLSFRVMPLLFLLFLPFFLKEKNFGRVASLFILTTFAIALPIGLYYLGHQTDFFGRTSEISIFSSPAPLRDLGVNILKTAGMLNIQGDGNWRHNYSDRPELFWPVGIFFLAGILTGLLHLRRNFRENFSFIFLFAWGLLAALPVVISNEGLPHALRAILLIPPAIMFAAVGALQTYNVLSRHLTPSLLNSVMVIVIAIVMFEPFTTYFLRWAQNPNVQGAFAAEYTAIGREINQLPASTPKYVIVEAGGVDVRGIPMPAQTVMFLTDSFTPDKQEEKNIHYVLPKDRATIPANAPVFEVK